MIRWMCNIKVKDRVPSKKMKDRLGIDDIISVQQQKRLQWYGHMLRQEDNDWVKNVWSVPDPEVDQRGLGQRLCKKTSSTQIEQG